MESGRIVRTGKFFLKKRDWMKLKEEFERQMTDAKSVEVRNKPNIPEARLLHHR